MEPNTLNTQISAKPKTSAKDFFLNLGAIVALYTVVVSLLNLLFTVIDKAYPQITSGYYYNSSSSMSFPVATLIIFFPIFVLLMWLLEKSYTAEPEKKHLSVRRWLTYITLFIAGLTLAIDLVWVVYKFIDGQELTTGFILKALSVLIIAGLVFWYYITDIREKMTRACQRWWMIGSFVLIVASIVWGFAVLGSPRTQQLLKYDEQKVNDLMNINSQIQSYYYDKGVLPLTLADLAQGNNYSAVPVDMQTGQSYEYQNMATSSPTNRSYKLCAIFNKSSDGQSNTDTTHMITIPEYHIDTTWLHQSNHFCFTQTVTANNNPKAVPVY
jgi:type II secretory pathway pseudopilin PulG